MPKNLAADAHDALSAAKAIHLGYALLTGNVADFTLFAGFQVEKFS
ncbi:MAG: hypothetical protein IPN53_13445 [Comamonadaceae bacterium]|nr:hypothetical protein [Comamonadaceae bacterium]